MLLTFFGKVYSQKSNNSQRGVGRGYWGEGSLGTTIKDTWTKSRGRVEVGEVGLAGVGWRDGEKMQIIVTE